jgi:nucleoporin NDC1
MTPDPALTLISGITSPDAMFKYFAYSELKELAMDQSAAASSRRTALFGDQKYTPNLWSRLLREALILLGQDYQLFLNRGKAPPPAPPPPPAPAIAAAPPIPSISTPLIKKPIYQSSKQSPIRTVIDSFASDGPLPQAVDAGVDTVHLPELFRSLEAVVLPPLAKEGEAKKGVEGAKGLMSWIVEAKDAASGVVGRNAPAWATDVMQRWVEWWTKERVSKVVEGCLPRRSLDVVVVEGKRSRARTPQCDIDCWD